MIANSGSDERGRASGGQQGDQTGREWQIRSWYNRPWSCVLRYPDEKVAKLIAELAKEGANNNNIGYDQSKRTTFWNELKKVGYRPSNIKVKCSEDCSAGVSAIVKAVGYLLNIEKLKQISEINWTGSMRINFRNAGFQVVVDSKYLLSDKYLKAGDILLNDSHHTWINLDNGIEVSNTIKVKKYQGGFPIIPPNLKKGSIGLQVERLQRFLNWYGDYGLVVDGDFGEKTRKAVFKFQQKVFYNDVTQWDGIFGKKSLEKAKAVKK